MTDSGPIEIVAVTPARAPVDEVVAFMVLGQGFPARFEVYIWNAHLLLAVLAPPEQVECLAPDSLRFEYLFETEGVYSFQIVEPGGRSSNKSPIEVAVSPSTA